MSREIQQAVNQVRLTNIAVVRLKRHGMRFELACYKNKVANWRSGIETDLDEVLQVESIFANVGKGVLASSKDVEKAFGTTDNEQVCRTILQRGELQVSERERALLYENTFKDIASVVAGMCVNPESNRPYPVTTIEQAMHDIHVAVKPNKPVKKQALEVIASLKKHMPLQRAQMHIAITIPGSAVSVSDSTSYSSSGSGSGSGTSESGSRSDFKPKPKYVDREDLLRKDIAQVTNDKNSIRGLTIDKHIGIRVEVVMDPGRFRAVENFAASVNGSIEILQFQVLEHGEADVEQLPGSKAKNKTGKQQREGSQGSDKKEDDYGGEAASDDEGDDDQLKKNSGNFNSTGTNSLGASTQAQSVGTSGSTSGKKSKKKKRGKNKNKNRNAVDDQDENGQQDSISQPLSLTQNTISGRESSNTNARSGEFEKSATSSETKTQPERETGSETKRASATSTTEGGGLKCNTCGSQFGNDRSLQAQHYRSDLHRYNLKLKMNSLPPVTQEEYTAMSDADRDAVLNDWKAM